ncbi:MAG: hypothetical protein BJ554DRAFT_4584, partial [Olpidium bornovanus]
RSGEFSPVLNHGPLGEPRRFDSSSSSSFCRVVGRRLEAEHAGHERSQVERGGDVPLELRALDQALQQAVELAGRHGLAVLLQEFRERLPRVQLRVLSVPREAERGGDVLFGRRDDRAVVQLTSDQLVESDGLDLFHRVRQVREPDLVEHVEGLSLRRVEPDGLHYGRDLVDGQPVADPALLRAVFALDAQLRVEEVVFHLAVRRAFPASRAQHVQERLHALAPQERLRLEGPRVQLPALHRRVVPPGGEEVPAVVRAGDRGDLGTTDRSWGRPLAGPAGCARGRGGGAGRAAPWLSFLFLRNGHQDF